MFSKPADLITAWLIAGIMLLSIAIVPVVQFRDPPSERPGAVRDIATQKFDLKATNPGALPTMETPAAAERIQGEDRHRDRRVTSASFQR